MLRLTSSLGSRSLLLVSVCFAGLGMSLAAGGNLEAQIRQENFWITNGPVNAIVRSGNTVYVGGTFSQVGPVTGVRTWFGGQFSIAGGQSRNGLAAFDAKSGEVIDWNPLPKGNDVSISTLALSGSRVYVGGYFTEIGGQARNGLAALDTRTGQATAWDPQILDGFPYDIAISGDVVYVAGYFTKIGGQTRKSLAAVDATTGLATDWDPDPGCTWCEGDDLGVGAISDIEVSGGTLYVRGGFTSIGGQPRSELAAVDLKTGQATAWNPQPQPFGGHLASSGSTIYVGDFFTSIGGQARNNLAAVDSRTGMATAWNPNCSGRIYAMTLAGNTVYIGGEFSSVGGDARIGLAAVNATTGNATAWTANLPYSVDATGAIRVQGRPNAIAASQGSVYVGGSFDAIDGQPRPYLAAFSTQPVAHSQAKPNVDRVSNLELASRSSVRGLVALQYRVPLAGRARLDIFDVRGRRVATVLDRDVPAGWGEVSWDKLARTGNPVPSGIFFAELRSGNERQIRKLVIMN